MEYHSCQEISLSKQNTLWNDKEIKMCLPQCKILTALKRMLTSGKHIKLSSSHLTSEAITTFCTLYY